MHAAPVWAWASLAIAAVTFAISWAPLAVSWIVVLGAVTAMICTVAYCVAPRLRARKSVTVLGLAIPALLVAFACVYAAAMLHTPGIAARASATPADRMREPLLLSLSLLTTVGAFDIGVHRRVRSIAYLEMLLVATALGGASVVAFRRASQRLDGVLATLERERGPRG